MGLHPLWRVVQSFGRYGVPLDVVCGPGAPDGVVLPELLTPDAVVDVFDATSVDMSSQEETAMLQSPDFFDVRQYPAVHFKSTSVETAAPDRYIVHGLIEIRGITQPLILDAKLVGRHPDPARGAEVAEFVVNGTLQRSAFGMTADKTFISDKVAITIRARIQLSATVDAR
jgi:polyisoprenoid-binding protein YceI